MKIVSILLACCLTSTALLAASGSGSFFDQINLIGRDEGSSQSESGNTERGSRTPSPTPTPELNMYQRLKSVSLEGLSRNQKAELTAKFEDLCLQHYLNAKAGYLSMKRHLSRPYIVTEADLHYKLRPFYRSFAEQGYYRARPNSGMVQTPLVPPVCEDGWDSRNFDKLDKGHPCRAIETRGIEAMIYVCERKPTRAERQNRDEESRQERMDEANRILMELQATPTSGGTTAQ